MPKPDADPHGGPEAFEEIEENEICEPGTNSTNVSIKNEMR